MIETTVESIRVSLVTQNRVVILKEVEGDRRLPIWIGAYEAEAIAMELQGIPATRPLPYDLMRGLLTSISARVDQIAITDLTDQVFFARVLIEHAGQTIDLDSRPSDAIALAVRTGARILVSEAIMDQVGVSMDVEDEEDADLAAHLEDAGSDTTSSSSDEASGRKGEDRLGVFRDFINTLDLDDFDRKRSS